MLAGNREEHFVGKVVGVSPGVTVNNEYVIWVDVTNRESNGFYLLNKGMMTTVTIPMD